MASTKKVFVLGASGEIGKALVRELVSRSYCELVLIGRRKIEYTEEPFTTLEQRIVDFENLENYEDSFKDFDVGFCCLGTTRFKAGADGFVKVDRDYVVKAAKVARDGNCQHFQVVSSQGADANSWLLYPKTKGQMEEQLKNLNYPRLSIFRPSLLLCEREESRPLEKLAQFVVPKTLNAVFPNKYAIPTTVVAKAMANNAWADSSSSIEVFENRDVHHLSTVYSH